LGIVILNQLVYIKGRFPTQDEALAIEALKAKAHGPLHYRNTSKWQGEAESGYDSVYANLPDVKKRYKQEGVEVHPLRKPRKAN